jgi:hypothetical protein
MIAYIMNLHPLKKGSKTFCITTGVYLPANQAFSKMNRYWNIIIHIWNMAYRTIIMSLCHNIISWCNANNMIITDVNYELRKLILTGNEIDEIDLSHNAMFLGQFSENSQGKGCCLLGELLLQIISCHIIVMKKDGNEVLDVIIREVYCKQYLRPTYSEMSF